MRPHDLTPHSTCEPLAIVARRVLNTPDGEKLMAALRARTVDRPVLTGSGDGYAMALTMALREGENTLYRWLHTLTQKTTEAPQQRSPLDDDPR